MYNKPRTLSNRLISSQRRHNLTLKKIVLVVVLMAVSAVAGSFYHTEEARELRLYKTTFLSRHVVFEAEPKIDATLRSFDGGRIWYLIEEREDGAVVILGEAEATMPGLLDRIAKFEVQYAQRQSH